jgi:predicted hotdog family 3-hydroxylacyl-ACP dehydratase
MRRTDGTLGSACGIELAAQAMAVHSRLVAGPGARTAIGYLLSVRDVWLGCRLLDATPGDLVIDASRQMGDGNGATYCFKLARAGSTLLSGRITVMLRSKVKE